MTAEEFSKRYNDSDIERSIINSDYPYAGIEDLHQLMVEFAKIKVEEALKAASKTVTLVNSSTGNDIGDEVYNDSGDKLFIDKNSILNSYPLTNIK